MSSTEKDKGRPVEVPTPAVMPQRDPRLTALASRYAIGRS